MKTMTQETTTVGDLLDMISAGTPTERIRREWAVGGGTLRAFFEERGLGEDYNQPLQQGKAARKRLRGML